MRRTWTIIGVCAVSARWYQSLLGLPETAPAHDDFGQIPLRWNGPALPSRVGRPRAPSLDEPRGRAAWQRPPLVFPCR